MNQETKKIALNNCHLTLFLIDKLELSIEEKSPIITRVMTNDERILCNGFIAFTSDTASSRDSTIFALYPSWRASKLRPVEALRYE
jgi:hypothetical protein